MADDKHFSLFYPALNSEFSNGNIIRYSGPRLNRVEKQFILYRLIDQISKSGEPVDTAKYQRHINVVNTVIYFL